MDDLYRDYILDRRFTLKATVMSASDEPTAVVHALNDVSLELAMGEFAVAYADQTERDHAALKSAVRAGKIEVHIED